MYVFKVKQNSQSTNGTPVSSFGDYSTESDPYIFLPATQFSVIGYYWSSESYESNNASAYCLYFWDKGLNAQNVGPKNNTVVGGVTVRRSSN